MSTEANFDYVIVGGGTAGCVVARRLLDGGASVCILESGGRGHHPLISMPAGFARLLDKPRFWVPQVFWNYQTVPQKHLDGRVIGFPQARILGGGSSINAMIYTRGNAEDYNQWSQLGARGWSYDEVLPYFKKAETNAATQDDFHGNDGPLSVSRSVGAAAVTDQFIAAAVEIGIPFNPDFNGARLEGVGRHQVTVGKGRRSSTARAYLAPVARSSRLRIVSGATVEKIVVEKGRATTVRYTVGGAEQSVRAGQEIILSAGTIGSPKILMLSGIGPAEHLSQVGIDVELDLKGVGDNLQDHFDCYAGADCSGPFTYPSDSRPVQEVGWLLQYLVTKSGPLASNFVEAGAFLRVDPASEMPDTQFHMLPAYVVDPARRPISGFGLSVYTNMLRPRSRGTVRLASSKSGVPPLIDPNFLSDPYDRKLTREGLRVVRDLLKANALSSMLSGERIPGRSVNSDEELDAFIRQVGKTDFHPVGTCRMGEDDTAVVDSELCVRGIEGLRVVDASVMPTLISGNTNAPTVMIAEKASDLILSAVR